jgi:hypothetical protein
VSVFLVNEINSLLILTVKIDNNKTINNNL